MPASPFESLALDFLADVTGGCGKKQAPPPPPPQPAAAPDPGPSAAIDISITGYGAPVQRTV